MEDEKQQKKHEHSGWKLFFLLKNNERTAKEGRIYCKDNKNNNDKVLYVTFFLKKNEIKSVVLALCHVFSISASF